jgi:hypothetical protein
VGLFLVSVMFGIGSDSTVEVLCSLEAACGRFLLDLTDS